MSAKKSSKTAGKASGKAAGTLSVPVTPLKEHIVEIISDSGEGAQRPWHQTCGRVGAGA